MHLHPSIQPQTLPFKHSPFLLDHLHTYQWGGSLEACPTYGKNLGQFYPSCFEDSMCEVGLIL